MHPVSLFGVLIQEREPPRLDDFGNQVTGWLQDAGGFAAFALVLWFLSTWLTRVTTRKAGGGTPLFDSGERKLAALTVVSLVLYAAGGVALLVGWKQYTDAVQADPNVLPPVPAATVAGNVLTAVGGAVALLAALVPFGFEAARLKWRRIWAIARLSFQEAVRRRVLWVFLAFLIIFLFPPKWFFPIKPEDEIRTNVSVIYYAMTPLLLVTAGLLAAFAIPNDIKSQTIHTIVTKPVERFEILAGRFLGYAGLLTAMLAGLTTFSLMLIWATVWTTGMAPEAIEESFKARQAVYGELNFYNVRGEKFTGDSVGREWEYRRYIAGRSPQRGLYVFPDLPGGMASLPSVPMEFAFDIFRTTKGEEGRGVECSFILRTWKFEDKAAETERAYEAEMRQAKVFGNAQPGVKGQEADWEKIDKIAEKYGIYRFDGKTVADYHTGSIQVPAGLFRNALSGPPPFNAQVGRTAPRLIAMVKCDSPTQFLGMAKYDLYLLRGDGNFSVNFYKGALGLWMRLLLVTGLAIAASTYLSGVISWLVTMFLFSAGLFLEFIQEVAAGKATGGGPAEAFTRLARGENLVTPIDDTPGAKVVTIFDEVFRWTLRRFINLIPDVERFQFTQYVAEGFNVPGVELLLNFVFLVGYLLPWTLLAYYLMRSREIAS